MWAWNSCLQKHLKIVWNILTRRRYCNMIHDDSTTQEQDSPIRVKKFISNGRTLFCGVWDRRSSGVLWKLIHILSNTNPDWDFHKKNTSTSVLPCFLNENLPYLAKTTSDHQYQPHSKVFTASSKITAKASKKAIQVSFTPSIRHACPTFRSPTYYRWIERVVFERFSKGS